MTTDLMPIVRVSEAGEPMADSRDVAAYFGKNHKDVLRAIRELGCSAEFRQRNFAPFKIKDLTGEHTSHVMMTKDGFTFLAMGFTGEKAAIFKERYIAVFNAMAAERATDIKKALRDPYTLRALLAESNEQVLALTGQVEDLTERVEDFTKLVEEITKQVKVLRVDSNTLARLCKAKGSVLISDVAKILNIPRQQMFERLHEIGWIYKRGKKGKWKAYDDKIKKGLLEHKLDTIEIGNGEQKISTQARVTAKGLATLVRLIPGAKRPNPQLMLKLQNDNDDDDDGSEPTAA